MLDVTRDGAVATVRLDRGDDRNALSLAAMQALTGVAEELSADDDLRAVILTGTPSVFSLGYDLAEARAVLDGALSVPEALRGPRAGRAMCRAWERIPCLTVAAVEGWCVGGGMVLACACDLRVLGAGGVFWLPEVERALNLSWGGVPRLTALVGPARAKRLAMLGERIGPETAEAWGLVDATAPAGGALEAARGLAARAAGLPPLQTRMIKRQVETAAHPLAEALADRDAEQFALARLTEDHREALAAFFDRRDPRYTGR